MKNYLLGLVIILMIAVGFLFYKVYSMGNNKFPVAKIAAGNDSTKVNGGVQTIAYIDMDSIQAKYKAAKVVNEEIKRKRANLLSQIESMEKAYKNKLETYQKKGNQMSEEEINHAGQDLKNLEASIMEKRQNADMEYEEFRTQKSLAIKKKIEDFLKIFNENKTYSFIMTYEPGLFYYKDPSFDITDIVIKGLNEQNEKKAIEK